MKRKIHDQDVVLKIIHPYIENKSVLDIGCVEHSIRNKDKERIWVHGYLKRHAKDLTGIDILKPDVAELKKQGYAVSVQSAESFSFHRKFDVIVAGELIEHLSNPGLFLERCEAHLNKGGVLIITTPNAFGIHRMLVACLRYTNNPRVNVEHTAWFSPKVITGLIGRYKFKVEAIRYANYPYFKPRIDIRFFNWMTNLTPHMKETMIVICRRK